MTVPIPVPVSVTVPVPVPVPVPVTSDNFCNRDWDHNYYHEFVLLPCLYHVSCVICHVSRVTYNVPASVPAPISVLVTATLVINSTVNRTHCDFDDVYTDDCLYETDYDDSA